MEKKTENRGSVKISLGSKVSTNSRSDKYQYQSFPVDVVAANVEEYLPDEIQEPCKRLWAKNIFTLMCSNKVDGVMRYIILDELSRKNEEIFLALSRTKPENYTCGFGRGAKISVSGLSAEAAEQEFLALIEPFKLQDITSGFMSEEEFLIRECGLGKIVPAPDGVKQERRSLFAEEDKYVIALDEDKVVKSIANYVKEKGFGDLYIEGEGRIYKNKFFFDRHMAYLEQENN